MTVSEAKLIYKTSKCYAGAGTNVVRICWQLYQDLDYDLIKALMLVNNRVDWTRLNPDSEIEYFTSDVMKQLV
jgi:hypothetical protein